MISQMLTSVNPAYYEFSEQELARIDPTHYPDLFDETIYESDEFRMYGFKIKQCPRLRSHDWTQCPFAHRGERARRRDPRKYNYAAVSCPDFRNGACQRGDTCHFSHGVFEQWLHPDKYRTRACNAGEFCRRKVCFFAHTPEELRGNSKYKYHYVYRVRSDGDEKGSYGGAEATSAALPSVPASTGTAAFWGENPDFLASLSGLKISEGGGNRDFLASLSGWYVAEPDVADDVEWITELVE